MNTTIKVLLVIAAFMSINTLNAQDVMIYRNGDEMNVKITEVGLETVKYKRSDNPDGPAYEVRKNEVFMIKYANGVKDVFKATPPNATSPSISSGSQPPSFGFDKYKPIENDYDKYMRMYNRRKLKGTICTSIGVPFVVLGVSLLAGGISSNELYYARNYNSSYYNNYNYGDHGAGAITAGSIFLAAGIPLSIVGAIQLGTSNKYLRKALETCPTLSFAPSVEPIKPVGNIGGSQMGLAMRLSF